MLGHRVEAESRSRTDLYCVADDDCMPLGLRYLERAEEAMRRYPSFALLAFSDRGGEISPLGAPWFEDDFVYEVASAGGIYLLRRGVVEYPRDGWIDDVWVGDHLKAKGWKVGYMKGVQMNHLGHRLSTCFPSRTGMTQIQ
jgi:hypothetical protein